MSKCPIISCPYFPVFELDTVKYGPGITPYLDTSVRNPIKHQASMMKQFLNEPCHVIQNPLLFRTLCNYNIFRLLIHLKLTIFSTQDIQETVNL